MTTPRVLTYAMLATADVSIEGRMDHVFDTVMSRERQRLYAIAYTILRDREEAADAVQEVMLRAWRSWSRTREHEVPGPWLTRICVNTCLTRGSSIRRRRGRDAQLLADSAKPAPQMSDPSLAEAYEHLSRQQRAVVLLHYHFGYSLDECADLMRCRPGTARSHLHRALVTLREHLRDG
ncbi:MAG: RNA polymerase sigma factor [Candidatus Dormibacteraeota bacterium]|nr:RNA polymerase sigma factor [Candidatus Dormibacteraeota bacterium]